MACDVVVFGAHPDDAEMGMGGTIARLCRSGAALEIVSMTGGERGTHGSAAIRAQEAQRAAAVLGCRCRILDFPDTAVVHDLATRDAVVDIVRELAPRIVFAPYHTSRWGHHDGAAHVDHLATGALVRDALKLARLRGVPGRPAHDVQRLYHYMVPRDRVPSLLVDVTEVQDVLETALQAYSTQMQIHRQGSPILDILRTYRRFHGIAAGCNYAEAFVCDEPLRADAELLFRL